MNNDDHNDNESKYKYVSIRKHKYYRKKKSTIFVQNIGTRALRSVDYPAFSALCTVSRQRIDSQILEVAVTQ